MNVHDLMIGDYVYASIIDEADKVPCKVTGINYNSWKGDDYCDWVDTDFWDELGLDAIQPIPLTEEILEKNGFTSEDGVHFQIQGRTLELLWQEIPFGKYQVDMVRTERTKNKSGQDCYIDHYIATIDYVHQLQHVLRFVGIDKEIVV